MGWFSSVIYIHNYTHIVYNLSLALVLVCFHIGLSGLGLGSTQRSTQNQNQLINGKAQPTNIGLVPVLRVDWFVGSNEYP